MKTNYTPGPWAINKANGIIYNDLEDHPRQLSKCICIYDGLISDKISPEWIDNEEECKANAQLIAAAPELLEALELLTDSHKGLNFKQWSEARKKALSAIVKAKGNG